MAFSRVCLFWVTVLAALVLAGCESTSGTGVGGEGSYKTAQFEGDSIKQLRKTIEVKATEIELRLDGSVVLPRFDLDTAIFVVDTSGSMRDRDTGLMGSYVLGRIWAFVMSMEEGTNFVILDSAGYTIVSSKVDGLAANETDFLELRATSLVKTLALYLYESDSKWLVGLEKALDLAREEGTESRTQIFIFGDEYTKSSRKELDRLAAACVEYPVNVIRAHERLAYGKVEVTAMRFEFFGSKLAELTGGWYFRFVPSAFSSTPEAMLLGRLAIAHPGETWYIDADAERVAEWNELLGDKFQTGRLFLVAGTEEEAKGDPKGIFVSINFLKRQRGAGVSSVQYRRADGSQDIEYSASLRGEGAALTIEKWETLK